MFLAGALCILKTGVRDGAAKGKSFYLCATQQTSHCSFVQPAEYVLIIQECDVEEHVGAIQENEQCLGAVM